MTREELDTILEIHKKWLRGEEDGKRAYLRSADLRGAYLRGADLQGADLRGADLRGADLRGAYLRGADLQGADLQGADLQGADLRGAYLRGADLRGAYLRGADLQGADLRGADLQGAYLQGALNVLYPIACPEKGSFTAFKKVCIEDDRIICELLIPASAKRSSATTRKCRADKAKVVAFYDLDGNKLKDVDSAFSDFDISFIYKIGETVEVEDFELDRWKECAPGIHFFLSFDEAKNY